MIRPVFCILLGLTSLHAAASDDPVEDLKKGQPKDVAVLIDRIVDCNHWSGEEAYDADRKKEILSALAELKCHQLPAAESAARKRYANNPKALQVLKTAREMYY